MARGPAYPFVNLEEAIALTQKMYGYSKRSPAVADSVVRDAWDASPTSSSSVKFIAALKYFGLIEDAPTPTGKPDSKLIKVTDRAYRIIADSEESPERKQAVKDAAISPKWYQFCWNKWGKDIPQSIRSTLLFEEGFVESTVDGFIKDYKKTIEYAGLLADDSSTSSSLPSATHANTEASGAFSGAPSIKIGDYVQWESRGQLQFKVPRQVIKFLDDSFAQVEGSFSGIPIAELTVVEKPPETTPKASDGKSNTAAHRPIWAATGMRQEVFSMSEGSVSIEWPASMSEESFEDFKDWLKILERKVKRSVLATNPPAVGRDDET